MGQFARLVGFVWALPLTLLGVAYALLFSLLGWYRWTGTVEGTLVWNLVPGRAPKWIDRHLLHWGGCTLGNVVALSVDHKSDRGKVVLRHELEHVHQFMVMGPFQPVVYWAAYLGLALCRHAHPRFDHPFEVDARRAAGQVVDVIGTLKRAMAEGRIKLPQRGQDR